MDILYRCILICLRMPIYTKMHICIRIPIDREREREREKERKRERESRPPDDCA